VEWQPLDREILMFNSPRLHLQALMVLVILLGVVMYEAYEWVWRMIG
jgi:hypothetical protein